MELHGLDTEREVFFYEQDFYVLSNFSAFSIKWQGRRFPTSEHAYHWEKFEPGTRDEHGLYVRDRILEAVSAHEAFKLAEKWKPLRRADWDDVKVGVMRCILREKARQHPYVLRKLLATGERTLIENSWRDDFWGWGPNRDGQNVLGRLWMQVRAELRAEDADARNSARAAWRDVADELPQEAQEVLFVRGGKTVHGAWIGGIFWHSNQKMAAAYWMPLPLPPNVGIEPHLPAQEVR